MKRVTIEKYVRDDDSLTGERLGVTDGLARVRGAARAFCGHHWADVIRDVLGLLLDRETDEALTVRVVEVMHGHVLCPRVVVLADGDHPEGVVRNPNELSWERRNLKGDHVWISFHTPGGPTVEAVVVPDPTFHGRQPEFVAAVEAAYGITDTRYWQLVALWCSTDHSNADHRRGYTNEVRDMLLELAAN